MNLTLSIDDQLLEKTRKRASEMGTTVNQMVRDYFKTVVGEDNLEADIALFRQTSGLGKPDPDYRFNREEIYEERLANYGKS
jgi:uncharacterized protein DUF6364